MAIDKVFIIIKTVIYRYCAGACCERDEDCDFDNCLNLHYEGEETVHQIETDENVAMEALKTLQESAPKYTGYDFRFIKVGDDPRGVKPCLE